MLSPLEFAGTLLFAVAVIGAFAWNIYYPRFLSRVQKTDATTWTHLGEPPLRWFGYTPTRQFMSYLHKRGYETLGDAQTVLLARRARAALISTYAGFCGALVLLGLTTWFRA